MRAPAMRSLAPTSHAGRRSDHIATTALTTRRRDLPMAEEHSDRYTGAMTPADGGDVSTARIRDHFAVAVESGALTASVRLDRAKVRDLALAVIDATQIDHEED
jgi:hypothetical protein